LLTDPQSPTPDPRLPDLWLIRLFTFVFIGAGGFLFPFVSLFYHRNGLSGTQIGLLGALSAGAGLLAAPFWGARSDRAARPVRVLQAGLVVTAAMILILGRQSQFLPIAFFVTLYFLASAGLLPLADLLAAHIAAEANNAGYGSVRLWGSLGWTIVTSFAGRLIELFGLYIGFAGNALGYLLAALTLRWLPRAAVHLPEAASAAATARPGLRQALPAVARSRRLAGLAVALGAYWLLSNNNLFQFEPIYMVQLGASDTLVGLANALNAAVELPAMLLADRLLRRFSAGWLLRFHFLLSIARALAVLLVPTIPMILATRAVLGLQFSLYSVAIIAYINEHGPTGYRVTTLALVTVTLRSLMLMIGSPISGLVFDASGAYWLYALNLGGSLLGWLALQLSRD
jgi:MFS transporter, PPP family, 3-phenylpropionic acid transporter